MGKPQFYPAVFDIDLSVCMSCQICVEVCPFEAIKMDKGSSSPLATNVGKFTRAQLEEIAKTKLK